MRIETVTKQQVSLRISRSEFQEKWPISSHRARTFVLQALKDAGEKPWNQMELHMVHSEQEVLIVAIPELHTPLRFRFSSFHELLGAIMFLPASIPSDVLYHDNGFELYLWESGSLLPNAVYEFGIPLPCTAELSAHLSEQEDYIARGNAVEILQKWFC